MKKFVSVVVGLVLGVVASLVSLTPAVASPGRQVVYVSECVINFNESVYWRGKTTDLWRQVIALHDILPPKCWRDDRCNFANIDNFYWVRMISRRFVSVTDVPDELMNYFRHCQINVNPVISVVDTGSASGSGNMCADIGNLLSATLSGNGNSVTVGQSGCNVAFITVNGQNIVVVLRQDGKNYANIKLEGDNINVYLQQSGSHSYEGTFYSNENKNIVQN